MSKISKQNNSGYAVLEVLFYILLFGMLSTVSINSLITMTRAFRETSVNRQLAQGATIVDRIVREIRQADTINSIEASSLDISNDSKNIVIALSGDDVELIEDESLIGDLNSPDLIIEDLILSEIATTRASAVRVVLVVSASSDKDQKQKEFYSTVVLRGGY